MSWTWWVWPIGGVALLAAGFGAAYLPRARAQDLSKKTAWSHARAAISRATISRDAGFVRVDEAERLLARAERLAADRGGRFAARTATEHAERADRLWREAADA